MASKVGSGDFIYEVDEEWAKLPEGWEMTAAAVAGDSQDRVYVFDRGDHPVMVFDREGNYLYSWGHDLIKMAHAIFVDGGDNVWLVDSHGGQIMKFTPEGRPLMRIGQRDYRSDTGVDPKDFGSDTYLRVTHAGGPFNIPAEWRWRLLGRCSWRTGTPTAGCIDFRRRGSIWHPGERRGKGRGTSTCRTGFWWTGTEGCWWRTGRTTGCRCSRRRGSTWGSGLRS